MDAARYRRLTHSVCWCDYSACSASRSSFGNPGAVPRTRKPFSLCSITSTHGIIRPLTRLRQHHLLQLRELVHHRIHLVWPERSKIIPGLGERGPSCRTTSKQKKARQHRTRRPSNKKQRSTTYTHITRKRRESGAGDRCLAVEGDRSREKTALTRKTPLTAGRYAHLYLRAFTRGIADWFTPVKRNKKKREPVGKPRPTPELCRNTNVSFFNI